MKGIKEIPGGSLEGRHGMRLYNGFMEDGLRFRTYVPTTIFDPLSAQIRVYKLHDKSESLPIHPEEVVVCEYVSLKSLPRWDVECQCLRLSTRDERNWKKAIKNLEKRLLE